MLTPGTILVAVIDRVYYYTDATGLSVVPPYEIIRTGTNIGQKESPFRNKGDVMGSYTGRRQANANGLVFLEVDWVNSFTAKRTSVLKGPYDVNAQGKSWVKESHVTYYGDPAATPAGNDPKPGNWDTTPKPKIDPKTGLPFLPSTGVTAADLASKSSNNTTLYVIIGVAVLLVGGVLFFLFKSPKSEKK